MQGVFKPPSKGTSNCTTVPPEPLHLGQFPLHLQGRVRDRGLHATRTFEVSVNAETLPLNCHNTWHACTNARFVRSVQ